MTIKLKGVHATDEKLVQTKLVIHTLETFTSQTNLVFSKP